MDALKYYDFTLTAGGSQVLLVSGNNFRIQSQTGAVDVTVDSVGTLPGLLTGQGLKDVPFKRLTLRDASGAPNVGTILVSPAEFVDNRTYGVMTLANVNGSFAAYQKTVDTPSGMLLGANPLRRYLLIQNNDPLIDIWVNLEGFTAGANLYGSIKIAANGGYLELQGFVPINSIEAWAASTNANVAVVEG